jgi:glycosyltransferase family protein
MHSLKFLFIFILICLFKYDKFVYSTSFELKLNCENCLTNKNIDYGCSKCSLKSIFQSLKVKSIEETVNEILYNKKSISRFGDGEFNLIFERGIRFQNYNKTLKEKLVEVLTSNLPNLLVGIIPLNNIKNNYWIKYFNANKLKLLKVINKNKIYYNSLITRFFRNSPSQKKKIKNQIIKFKQIWNNRNILIIEGEKTRIGVGNDLLDNCKSIKRIICPTKNAFNVYMKIYDFVKNLKFDINSLILISLGPTATVLSYELHKLGYQTLDFGHFDIQYEYFIRNVTKKIKIPTKYVNEVKGGDINIIPIKDKNYYRQIIFKAF